MVLDSKLVLITNRKSHMGFQLVPKKQEARNGGYYGECIRFLIQRNQSG